MVQQPRAAQVTAAAERLGLLDPGTIPWQQLPPLYGLCPVQDVLPGAGVFMETDDQEPVVISRDYGAGRALLVTVDDTWRWRRNVGDYYLHRFHSQLLRWVSGGHLLGRKPWRVVATPARAFTGADVTLAVVPDGPRADDIALPTTGTVRLQKRRHQRWSLGVIATTR